jgi:hypothetical protein
LISETGRDEVREIRHTPGLTNSIGDSDKYPAGMSMRVLLETEIAMSLIIRSHGKVDCLSAPVEGCVHGRLCSAIHPSESDYDSLVGTEASSFARLFAD